MKDLKMTLTENLYDPYTREQRRLYESILKSYSPFKLMQALEKQFNSYIFQYIRPNVNEYDKLAVVSFICTEENEYRLKTDKKFQSILNLFNYTFSYSYSYVRNGHNMKICVLEPNISDDYTDTIYNKWKGIVYHVTSQQNIKGIIKNGIRAKSGTYRQFDQRVFVTGGPEYEENIRQLIDDLNISYDYVVLKIDLNKNSHKLRFFRDPMQEDCLGLYTRENIDRKCLEIINYEYDYNL